LFVGAEELDEASAWDSRRLLDIEAREGVWEANRDRIWSHELQRARHLPRRGQGLVSE
jgi:hypothetical protein